MPLYEYECQTCRHHFELLVREQTVPACPSCQSDDIEKQLSVFAVGAASPRFPARSAAPAPCGSCGDPRGPGACSMN
jgi:putative FmdB family regulatory protein